MFSTFTCIVSMLLVISLSNALDVKLSLSDAERQMVQGDMNYLTKGISRISIDGGYPGNMNAFGKFSYRVASSNEGFAQWTAARMGYGKVCAFAHTKFCDMDANTLTLYDNTKLVQNCINWLTNNTSETSTSMVGLIYNSGYNAFPYNQGFIRSEKTSFETLDDLKGVQFLVVNPSSLDTDVKVAAVKSFVQQGGGLYICTTSWANSDDYLNYVGNKVLIDAGLIWAPGAGGNSTNIVPNRNPVADWWKDNAWYASALLLQDSPPASPNVYDVISKYITIAPVPLLDYTSPYSSQLVATLGLTSIFDKQCNLNYTFPINRKNTPMQHSCLGLVDMIKYILPLNTEHPIVKAASIIPGYPTGSRAKQNLTVTISLSSKTRWQSTGVFVWPGSKLKVTVPSALVNNDYNFIIGSHDDDLFSKNYDEYERWPRVSTTVEIMNTSLDLVVIYGGLIYLNIKNLNANLQPATITFTGEIVSAPWFVMGETSELEWRKSVSETTAPFGEVEGSDLVVTAIVGELKLIKNATNLAQWYDAVMGKYYELSRSTQRTYKERIVNDVQIGGGYAHSGYPIMTQDGVGFVEGWTTSVLTPIWEVEEHITYQSFTHWGMFHEIGHNFQKGVWTASGDNSVDEGEVTNNIFSLFLTEIYTDGPSQFGEKSQFLPGNRPKTNAADPNAYLLCFYIDLRATFGWEAFMQFFEYIEKHPEISYKNATDVTDNWLQYFSQVVQRDITPLFDAYQKKVSDSARQVASTFKTWNVNIILDCQTVTLSTSPCASLFVYGDEFFLFHVTTSSRINVTEAMEIKFGGGQPGTETDFYLSDLSDPENPAFDLWKSFDYNPTTKTVRMTPKKFIKAGSSSNFYIISNNPPFMFTDVSIKVVNIETSKAAYYDQPSLIEGIYKDGVLVT